MEDEEENRAAIGYCEDRLDENPEDGIYWLLKANCHWRLEEYEEAAGAYRRAGDLGEVKSHAYYSEAICLIELGRVGEAVEPLERQAEHTPAHLDAIFLLGICLRTIGETERGDRYLERARQLDTTRFQRMFSEYAELVADGTDHPMIESALRSAVRQLREEGD